MTVADERELEGPGGLLPLGGGGEGPETVLGPPLLGPAVLGTPGAYDDVPDTVEVIGKINVEKDMEFEEEEEEYIYMTPGTHLKPRT